ncbi:MAG: T9SS type A sorting domain-containing protein [Candidatus Zixiibacteriota bacterium]|nr:MAG: T9SS type A sorting domain-containing protein [candidate division Zixibacteria bacterium]
MKELTLKAGRKMFNENYLLAISFIIFIAAPILPAQNPNIIWMQIFGEGEFNCVYWVEQVGQGNYPDLPGFILAGCRKSYGQVHNDVLLIKTDGDGNTEWARTYGDSDNDAGFCVKPTSDSGFIVCGFFTDGDRSTSDGYIIKTDASGDTVWTRKYGDSGGESFAEITQTSDGGYIAAGYKTEPDEYHTDVYVVKTDSVGEVMWSREYGTPLFADHAKSVLQTSDGGYIICGVRGGIGTAFDVWLIKMDSGGNVEWNRTYGGDGYDAGYSVDQTSDGGYIVSGYKTILIAPYHHDLYLVKTSSDGTVQWERTYGESVSDCANSVREISDGGFIAAGLMETPMQGGCDIYVVKTDDNGDLQWFGTMSINDADIGYCVRQTDDGNFVIAGSAFSLDYIFDAFMMKINSGLVDVEDEMVDFIPGKFKLLQNYPNPFNTETNIEFYLRKNSNVSVDVFNVLGERVADLLNEPLNSGKHVVRWDASDQTSGVYFYRINTDGDSFSKKMLFLK